MKRTARNWRMLAGGMAAGSAAVLGLVGTTASADPAAPEPPAPAPVTVTQTVTVTPQAAGSTSTPATPLTAAPAPGQPASSVAAIPAAPTPTATPAAQPLGASAPAAAPTTPALPPATAGTLAEFLKEKGVVLEPQKAAGFTALNITLPVPTGWTVVPDPNVPDAFSVIADRKGGDALYTPNAQVLVSKLVGDFDPREAISHGYVDSQQLNSWQQTDASMADFEGFPSAVAAGTYRDTQVTLNTVRRHVIAQAGEDRYLVSLYVTTAANQVVATSAATEAILKGFKVAVPGAPSATPAPAAPAPATAAPVIDAAAPAPAAPAPAASAPAAPAVSAVLAPGVPASSPTAVPTP